MEIAAKSLIPGVVFLFLGGLCGSVANAANGGDVYYGFQYSQVDEDELDLEPTAAVFRVGSSIGPGYGYEFRVGTGLSGDDRSVFDPFFGDVSVDLEIDSLFGIYLVAEGDIGAASVYGIIGYTRVDFSFDFELGPLSGSDSEDESDLSFGFGANFGKSDKARFNIEYMQYLDKNDVDASAISVGVIF